MSTPKLKVGMLVEHPKRPQWGPGKIIAIAEDRVHVFFRDELEPRAKILMISHVVLTISDSQEDAVLDGLPPAKLDGNDWILTKAKRVPGAKAAATKAAKEAKLAEAAAG